jgi:hypothetical protein
LAVRNFPSWGSLGCGLDGGGGGGVAGLQNMRGINGKQGSDQKPERLEVEEVGGSRPCQQPKAATWRQLGRWRETWMAPWLSLLVFLRAVNDLWSTGGDPFI